MKIGINKDYLIYVVEDNTLFNRVVTEFLKRSGYQNVKSFHSGKDCLNAVQKGKVPHIVVQDYHLSDTNGIAVLQAVKQKSRKTQFIFLSANEDVEVAANTIKFGAFDYVTKDSDVALSKVVDKIGKICLMMDLERRNRLIRSAMFGALSALLVLALVVLLKSVHTIF